MRLVKSTLATLLVSLVFVSGCARHTPGAGSTTGSGTPAGSALPQVNPPYPGPYKTVEIGGVEFKQGRFPQGKYGGTLTRAIIGGEPKGFNPWAATDWTALSLGGLMFSSLVNVDPYTGQIIPDMAKELKIDPDGVTYTTVLRKGLKWSDGKPVTAEDVAFTYNTIVKGGYGNASLRDGITLDGKLPTVTVVDELTNKFVTPRPFAPFARQLSIAIAPKHIIEPIIKGKGGREAFQQLWAANNSRTNLVTLGPFRLTRYVPGQRVEFEASKNYYMVDARGQRLPYLSKLVYQIIPDVNTNLIKFKAKELDITQIRCRDAVSLLPEQAAGNFTLYNLGQGVGTTFLMFNMNQRKSPKTGKPFVDPIKSAWFNDVNFRQAVNHALDRDNMVANYFKGLGFPQYTSESPASPYFNSSLKPFPQNLNYSMDLLKKSGFVKKPDGFLYDKDGHKVEFDMLAAAGGTFYQTIGNMIVDDLKKLGMKVNFQPLDGNLIMDKVHNSQDWQACLSSLSGADALEPHDGANVYTSGGRMHEFDERQADSNGKVTVTDARPWEQRLDQIFNEAAGTLNKDKRHELYNEYQQIIYDQAPFIYTVSPTTVIGTRNTLGNYSPTPLSQMSNGLHNLEEIYLK